MSTFALDLYRACLLIWRCLQWGTAVVVRRLLGLSPGRLSTGYRLRRIIEGMGATFVKLGQYFAIRYDLLPAEVCRELSKLLNEASRVDFKAARKVVEAELGGRLEDHFISFDTHPVGSASIAQVYRAVALDGQRLAVKVQRPGVADAFRADLRNLLRIARVADRFRLLGAISLVEVVTEMGEFTLREIDFVQEGRMADQLREGVPPFVKIPQIRWDMTTRRVLSMEFFDGVSLLSICEWAETRGADAFEQLLPDVDPEQLVTNLAHECLRQLFVTGVFHGDPHPANFLIGPDGTICFIDFGIFGHLRPAQRERLAELMHAMAVGRHEKAYRCYLGLAVPTEDTDIQQFRLDMLAVLKRWHGVVSNPSAETFERLAAGFQTQVLQLSRRHHLRVENDQVLFWRALALLDATAHRLPGGFNMLSVMRSFFELNRPGVTDRLMRVATDQSRVAGFASLLEQSPRLARLLPASVGRLAAHGDWQARQPVAVRRRGESGPLRRVVLLLVAVSFAVVAGSVGLSGVPRAFAGGACAVLFVAALRNRREVSSKIHWSEDVYRTNTRHLSGVAQESARTTRPDVR